MPKHPITGCRPDQLFGAWAIEPQQFRQMVDLARGVDLVALNRRTTRVQSGEQAIETTEVSRALAFDDDDEALLIELPANEKPYILTEAGVAILCITGPLTKYPTSFQSLFGGTSTVMLRRAVRQAKDDPDVQSLILEFDCPGGTVAGTADLAQDLRDFRAAGKPLVAYISDLCASAAYWLASQCDRIVANSTALVGCIGTYGVLYDVTGAQAKEGVRLVLITTGKYKGLGADGAVTEPLIEDAQREVNDLNDCFLAEVAAGRAAVLTPAQVRELADGRVHVGDKAKSLKLIDEVSTLDATFASLTAAQPQKGSNMDPVLPNGAAAAAKPPTTSTAPAQPAAAAAPAPKADDEMSIDTTSADYKAGYDAGYANGHTTGYSKAKADMDDEDGDEDGEGDGDGTGKEARKAARKAAIAGPTAEQFMTAFGDQGARWFIQKKPFAECSAEFIASLKAEHATAATALKTENDALKQRLSALPVSDRGNEPAAFNADPKAAPPGVGGAGANPAKHSNLPTHLKSFAGSIKIPQLPNAAAN